MTNPDIRFGSRPLRGRTLAAIFFALGSTLGLQAGLSCVEYVEQLTMLLFLNMADQLTEPPHSKPPIVPPNLGWKPLLKLDGAALEKQYSDSIEKLGLKSGMLGVIFKGARCDIHNPALFEQLIVNLLRFVLRNFESPLGTMLRSFGATHGAASLRPLGYGWQAILALSQFGTGFSGFFLKLYVRVAGN